MHIHNNFGNRDDHNSLCNGTIDFKDIFNLLKEKNISPKIVFEIFEEAALRESVAYFNSEIENKSF